MNVVLALTGRNLRTFFRDRMNVVFSLLGALILFALYALFLGNLQVEGLTQSLPGASAADVQAFVDSWMFAGVVLITTVTSGLGALAAVVDDGQSGRFREFLVAPIRRAQLVAGYLLAAVAVAMAMSAIVFAASLAYLGLLRGTWLEAGQILRALGVVILSCIAFTAFSALMVSFVRTSGAYSALATIVGTVLGFIAAAYLPMGALPTAVGSVVAALPFAQAGMLLRREYAADALERMTAQAPAARPELRSYFGLDLDIAGWSVPVWAVLASLVALTAACAAASALRIRRHIR
jgi:multidrug/hemolysin transport system permease protein